MKSKFKFAAHVVLSLALTSGMAMASRCGYPGTPACAVPEPGTLPLLLGALGIAVIARFFKRK